MHTPVQSHLLVMRDSNQNQLWIFHREARRPHQGSQVLDGNEKWNAGKYGPPQASGGSGLHVIVWFKTHLHSYNSHEGHILLKRKLLPSARTLTIMRTDKAFDSWTDENCVFYDQYELACGGRRREREVGGGVGGRGDESEWESAPTALIQASQPPLLWPQPRLLQPDDWFLFEAMPMGLIKSKCKLTLITNCGENASSQLPP